MLMLKADAYGHGATQVALATEDIVDAFGVATIEEGIKLRRAGIEKEILVLICSPNEMERALLEGLSVGLHCDEQLEKLARLISSDRAYANRANVHIKLDTGMHRLGFLPSETERVTAALEMCGANVRGVYSHLRARDYLQKERFTHAIGYVKARYPHATAHLAASENLRVGTLQFDAVRVGIAAYRGAMTVKSEVVERRRIAAGEHIGYGNFKVREDKNVAIVFGGYADGVKRECPSCVLIRGRKCAPLGRVCMDMFAVDTGDFLADIGEEVTLLSGEMERDVARERKTIEYTVMTGWHGRGERIYLNDKSTGKKGSS